MGRKRRGAAFVRRTRRRGRLAPAACDGEQAAPPVGVWRRRSRVDADGHKPTRQEEAASADPAGAAPAPPAGRSASEM